MPQFLLRRAAASRPSRSTCSAAGRCTCRCSSDLVAQRRRPRRSGRRSPPPGRGSARPGRRPGGAGRPARPRSPRCGRRGRANCSRRSRSSLLRDRMPASACGGPTVSVPSGSSSSPAAGDEAEAGCARRARRGGAGRRRADVAEELLRQVSSGWSQRTTAARQTPERPSTVRRPSPRASGSLERNEPHPARQRLRAAPRRRPGRSRRGRRTAGPRRPGPGRSAGRRPAGRSAGRRPARRTRPASGVAGSHAGRAPRARRPRAPRGCAPALPAPRRPAQAAPVARAGLFERRAASASARCRRSSRGAQVRRPARRRASASRCRRSASVCAARPAAAPARRAGHVVGRPRRACGRSRRSRSTWAWRRSASPCSSRPPADQLELPVAVGLRLPGQLGIRGRHVRDRGGRGVGPLAAPLSACRAPRPARPATRGGLRLQRSSRPVAEFGPLPAEPQQLRLLPGGLARSALAAASPRRDLLPGVGQLRLLVPQRVLGPAQPPGRARAAASSPASAFAVGVGQLRPQSRQHRLLGLQRRRELAVLRQPRPHPQFLQPVGVLLVTLGLRGLQPDGAELLLELVEDVARRG